MERMRAVGDEGLEGFSAAWNDGGRLLPRAPADLRHEAAAMGLCERYALGPDALPDAVGTLRRHFAFRQGIRLALDLRVRPERRGRGLGGSLLAQLLRRAHELGAEVVRAYAPVDDPGWDALAARHDLHTVESDRYLLLELEQATIIEPRCGPAVASLAGEALAAEQEAWQLEQRLHGALATSAPHVPETLAQWRARVLEAPGCSPEAVLVSRDRAGAVAGICALRTCVADPATVYHAFTGVEAGARGQGHGLALKLAAIDCARGLGARRLVADTSPANAAMLALNERLGYRAVLDVRNLEGSP